MTVGEDFPRERARCRRAALAPEAQPPSGEPWRPAVGEECLYYFGQSWLRARRIADQGNPDDDSDQEAFPQRFETIDAKTGCGYLYCDATYDGVRPLGSLPVPPSCGGEPEPRERADRPAVASERPGLARLLEWARREEIEAGAEMERERVHGDADTLSSATGRHDACADCVREIEREIAALGPPSIAEDLRTPEPGTFEGAVIVGEDDQLEREIEALAREVTREDRNRAVREALAELREWARRAGREAETTAREATTNLGVVRHQGRQEGYRDALDALDRMAERFK